MSIYNGFTEEDFGYWVFEMDDKLESFIASLYGDIKKHLDYSVDSLGKAEQWLINTYKTPDAIAAKHRAITVDGFCRYIGEVFRKELGGYWDMSFENTDSEQSGPFIAGSSPTGESIVPLELIKKALELRSGNFLKNHLSNLIET